MILTVILSSCGVMHQHSNDGILIKQKAICTYNDGHRAFFEYKKLGRNGVGIVEYETTNMNIQYEVGRQYIVVVGKK